MFLLESRSNTSDPESILARLQAAAAESEEQSDQLADDLYENKLSVDEFLEQFKTSRTEMHLRKLKAEKMQDLLRRGAHMNNSSNPTIGSAFPPPSTGFYGPTPYPTNMPAFPMPMMPRPSF